MAVPFELVTQLGAQHPVALARLLGEIGVAFDETLAMLSKRFPDPRQIPGGTLCSNVRSIVLAMNGINAVTGTDPSPPKAPKGASCGLGSTLRMTSGPNSSVRIGDTKKVAWARVRKLGSEMVEALGLLTPQPMPAPRAGQQMALDAGEPESQRVMGPPGIGECYEFVVYWWPTSNRVSVAGGILAAVEAIDTSEERILAFAALPPAIRFTTCGSG